jgi:hypothetical protein
MNYFAFATFALTITTMAHAGPTAAHGPATTAAVPTACTLFTPQEIASITGLRVREGEPQTTPTGTECRFRSSASEWLNVALAPIDAKTFARFRALLGAQAEIQSGVGDEAYFLGNVRIYVRAGTQGLIMGFARNDQGNAATKAQLLALAKAGAQRLR